MGTMFERVYEIVRHVPDGKVSTYGQIAALMGNVRWARAVGYALHVNPDPEHVHCFKVVNRDGRLAPAFAFGGSEVQKMLLEKSGVEVRPDNTVDLEKYLWHPGE